MRFGLARRHPREMLGLFIGLRARHYDNLGQIEAAERDYLVAGALFPQNRRLHNGQVRATVQMASEVFDPREKGHPIELAAWLPPVVLQLQRREEKSRAHQSSTITNFGDQ